MTRGRNKTSHKLEAVARRELGQKLSKEHQMADWGGEVTPGMLAYAARDAEVLLHLVDSMGARLKEAGLERVAEIEHRVLPAVTRMGNAEVPFDEEGWREHLKRVEEEKDRLKDGLDELAPEHPDGKEWNWNSTQQIK
jgi:ribonuclease D